MLEENIPLAGTIQGVSNCICNPTRAGQLISPDAQDSTAIRTINTLDVFSSGILFGFILLTQLSVAIVYLATVICLVATTSI